MWLVAPSGDSVFLTSNSTISNGFQCFAMLGWPLGTDLNAPFIGDTYQSFQSFNVLHGTAQGTWRLNIKDNNYDSGSINQYLDYWRIETGENIALGYQWSFLSNCGDCPYGSTYAVAPTATTTYAVTVYGQNGCPTSDTITVSVLVGTEGIAALQNWDVQPNPTANAVQVNAAFDTNTDGILTVTNSIGQTLITQPFATQNNLHLTLDMHDYAAGLYFLRLQTKDGTAVKKLLKQ